MSRLHLSSKSLPGVLEDYEVPDGTGVGVGGSSIPIETFPGGLGIRLSHGLTINGEVNVKMVPVQ